MRRAAGELWTRQLLPALADAGVEILPWDALPGTAPSRSPALVRARGLSGLYAAGPRSGAVGAVHLEPQPEPRRRDRPGERGREARTREDPVGAAARRADRPAGHAFILLEDVIRQHLPLALPGRAVVGRPSVPRRPRRRHRDPRARGRRPDRHDRGDHPPAALRRSGAARRRAGDARRGPHAARRAFSTSTCGTSTASRAARLRRARRARQPARCRRCAGRRTSRTSRRL